MGTGVGEAMLISAAVGAGTGAAGSAISGGDPLKGALTGAALGAVGGGLGAGFGAAGGTAGGAAGAGTSAGTAAGQAALEAATPEALNALASNAGVFAEGSSSLIGTEAIPSISTGAVNVPGYTGGISANPNMTGIDTLTNVGGTPLTPFNAPITPDASKGFLNYQGPTPNVFNYGPQSNTALATIGASSGISGAMQAERDKYGIPETEKYTGPLSRFKYDPSTYNPDVVRPPNPPYRAVYAAEGGIMSLAPNGYAMGGVPTRPPQTNFANPSSYEEGTSQYSMATDPMSGNIANRMAEGGITSLGSYSDGGRLLKGPGDGMSDNIPARIGRKQEARLADGEFVVPADVVSHLGNGSTDAGAKTLYAMMNKVRKARTGTKKQGRQIQASSYLPA
jgi:hypothetical protein